MPSLAFRYDLRLVRADFLMQFTQRGSARGLALVNPALRHLPAVHCIDPATNPYPAVRIH